MVSLLRELRSLSLSAQHLSGHSSGPSAGLWAGRIEIETQVHPRVSSVTILMQGCITRRSGTLEQKEALFSGRSSKSSWSSAYRLGETDRHTDRRKEAERGSGQVDEGLQVVRGRIWELALTPKVLGQHSQPSTGQQDAVSISAISIDSSKAGDLKLVVWRPLR